MKPIKLYWWQGDGAKDPSARNFGDYLSPLIVEMVSRRAVEFAPVKHADMLAIGTILSKERQARLLFLRRRLHVWGSGAGKAEERFWGGHHYHAVRGALTRALIDNDTVRPALGDPGLLAAHWLDGKAVPPKEFTLGVVPHFVDQQSPVVEQLGRLPGTRIINVFDPVEDVLQNIRKCHFILSSSMHGLIVSDAFGIPNRRLVLSDKVRSSLKFQDYYSVFGLSEPVPLSPADVLSPAFSPEVLGTDFERPGIGAIQEGLLRSFPTF